MYDICVRTSYDKVIVEYESSKDRELMVGENQQRAYLKWDFGACL